MKTEDSADRPEKAKKSKSSGSKIVNVRWAIIILGWSFVLSVLFSFFASELLEGAGYILSLCVLLFFILIGILFDIVGIAVASATDKSFHSMAAKKVYGAKQAIWLVKNADRVSSFCNDVIGDICGIISGTTAGVIIARINMDFSIESVLMSLVVTGLVSGFTVGGKALAKGFAIASSDKVVFFAARIIGLFKRN